MFGGHDTTASALSFIFYSLACNPEHQKICRDEIMQVLDGKDALEWQAYILKILSNAKQVSATKSVSQQLVQVRFRLSLYCLEYRQLTLCLSFLREDLSKIPYTTMCIKESLRLYPPAPATSRKITKPITFFDGRTVPAGLLFVFLKSSCRQDSVLLHT